MPESYTYIHIATHAMLKSGRMAENIPVYYAGANGPDPLFMYRFFHKQGAALLNGLGGQIQQEQTGAFLLELLKQAKSAQQRSFAQGFLTHYASACTLNPYIVALDGKGPYSGARERRTFEASLDATLYYSLYKTERVPALAGTPVLVTEDLAQVTGLLNSSIKAVYGADVPVVMLCDAYHNNTTIHRALAGKGGLRRFFVRLAASFNAGQKASGDLFARAQPVPRLGGLPASWQNPYTQEEQSLTLEQVTARAEDLAAEYLRGAEAFWREDLSAEEMLALLGNNNYLTGQPVSGESVPEGAAEPGAPAQEGAEAAPTPAAPAEEKQTEAAEPPVPQAQAATEPPAAPPASTDDTAAEPQAGAAPTAAAPRAETPLAQTAAAAPAPPEAAPAPATAAEPVQPPQAPCETPAPVAVSIGSDMPAAAPPVATQTPPPQKAEPPATKKQPEPPAAQQEPGPCVTHPIGTFLTVDAPPAPAAQPGHTAAPHWQGQEPSQLAEPQPQIAAQPSEPPAAQAVAPLPASGPSQTPAPAPQGKPLSATAQFTAIKPDAPAPTPLAPPAPSVPPAAHPAPVAAPPPPVQPTTAAAEPSPAAPPVPANEPEPGPQPETNPAKKAVPAEPPASEADQNAPAAPPSEADRRRKLEDALAWASGKPVYMPPSAPVSPPPSAPGAEIQPGVPYKRKKK